MFDALKIMASSYGAYVFSAYLLVIIFLVLQWWLPWRKWQKFLRAHQQIARLENKKIE